MFVKNSTVQLNLKPVWENRINNKCSLWHSPDILCSFHIFVTMLVFHISEGTSRSLWERHDYFIAILQYLFHPFPWQVITFPCMDLNTNNIDQ